MSSFRMYPTREQEQRMLLHCAHARYLWNLAVHENEWLRAGNADVQQQALKDFAKAKAARITSGFGEPTWRKKYRHEGFRVIGVDRVPEFSTDGTPLLNTRTGKQVRSRSRHWAQVRVPGCGWVRFRLTRADLPKAKTFRVRYRNGQWHIAFAVVPERPVASPGTGMVLGVDRGVRIKGSARKTAEYAKAAQLKAREANRRKDWCEKTSTMLARTCDLIRFEKLNIKNMTRSAKGTGRTAEKAPGRVEDVPAPYTSLRCSACGWIEKSSRKSQAEFICVSCGFTCNADENAAVNVAAGQGGTSRPGPSACAGGVTTATSRSSTREPQPTRVGIPLTREGEDVKHNEEMTACLAQT